VVDLMSSSEVEKWKTLKLPSFLYESIQSISERENRAMWEVIADAFSYYEAQKRQPKLKMELPILEKLSWYIAKITYGVSFFLAKPTDVNYTITIATLDETEKRLGVDLKELKDAVAFYKNLKRRSKSKRITVVKVMKITISRMIENTLSKTAGEKVGSQGT
jgi:hypothetical protein